MRRWLVALAALAAGGAASGAVLAVGGGTAAERVYVVTRDIPAGAALDASALAAAPVRLDGAQAALAYPAAGAGGPLGLRATHDLVAGQIVQRADVAAGGERRLVLVAVKDLPPVRAGDLVDLFALGDSGHPAAIPFALGVRVAAAEPGALVLSVEPRQAPGFVFASSMPLAAVVVSGRASAPPAASSEGRTVTSAQDAQQVASS